jgi:hypothetical protein
LASRVSDFESEPVALLVASGLEECAALPVSKLLRPWDAIALTHDRRTKIVTLTSLLNEAEDINLIIVFIPASTSFGFGMLSGLNMTRPSGMRRVNIFTPVLRARSSA